MPNANIDYVTSHQGTAHITTQNVIDLLAGLNGDVSGIKRFPLLYNGLANEITDALTIQVKTGAALAGGSFFILEDAFDWLLDAGAVGYSRIDILYLVMYEDPITNVQSCDFIYQAGNLYPNGTTGTQPSAPTGTNITATYPFLRMDMTDGSIVSVTEYAEDYLDNEALISQTNTAVASVSGTVTQVQTNKNDIAQMKVDFQDGVDTIYNAIVAQGVTPTTSTPSDCAVGIGTVATKKYNAGQTAAQSVTWTESLSIMGTVAVYGATGYVDSNPKINIDVRNAVSINCTSITTDSGTYNYGFINSGGSSVGYGTAGTGALSIPSGAQRLNIELDRSVNNPGNTGFSATANFTIVRQAKVLR